MDSEQDNNAKRPVGRPRKDGKPAGRPGPGRPRKPEPKPHRLRERDLRKTKTLADAVEHCVANYPRGALDIQATLGDIKVKWEDLELIALAFVSKGLELLPTVVKATDALACADRLMSILEKHHTMEAAIRCGLASAGIALHFATPEDLGLGKAEEDA